MRSTGCRHKHCSLFHHTILFKIQRKSYSRPQKLDDIFSPFEVSKLPQTAFYIFKLGKHSSLDTHPRMNKWMKLCIWMYAHRRKSPLLLLINYIRLSYSPIHFSVALFMSKRGNNETRRHTNRKRDETRLQMVLVVCVMIIMMIVDHPHDLLCLFVCAGREEDRMVS